MAGASCIQSAGWTWPKKNRLQLVAGASFLKKGPHSFNHIHTPDWGGACFGISSILILSLQQTSRTSNTITWQTSSLVAGLMAKVNAHPKKILRLFLMHISL